MEGSKFHERVSLAAVMPMGGSYGVSKHGVLALTEGVQSDLEQRGANIQAGVLCPDPLKSASTAAVVALEGASLSREVKAR